MKDVLTRVPLFGRLAGGLTTPSVATSPVQTADILETMIDLAGINTTALDEHWVRFAETLRPTLESGNDSATAERFVFAEGGFNFENEQMIEAGECLSQCPNGLYCPRGQEEALPNGSPRAVMIRNRTHKLVYRASGISELYELKADSRELNNLFTEPSAANLRSELQSSLLDWYVQTADVTPSALDTRSPPSFPHPVEPGDPWAAPLEIHSQSADPHSFDYMEVNGVIEA